MPKQLTKTLAQNKAIFGLASKMHCGREDLAELVFDVTGGRTEHISKLTFDEANGVIVRLGGRAFTPQFNSKRTEQYHRQKAGVEQIVSQAHLAKLNQIWSAKPDRTNEGLTQLCQRVIKSDRPRTTKDCNKIIEAIKSMNQRNRAFGAFQKDEKEAA